MVEAKNSKKGLAEDAFFERHGRVKKFLQVCIVIAIILLGLNMYSYLAHRSLLVKGNQPERYNVLSVKLLIQNGGRLAWSPDGNSLYYDKVDNEAGEINNFPVYTIYRYDFASESSQKIISSDDLNAPMGNKGQPAISPNGTWLLFQGEYEDHDASRMWCHPGKGKHNNLWVMNLNTEKIFQLTNLGKDEGVLHPHFDPTGSKICYSHLYSGEGWTGSWQINVADFSVENKTPSLTNIENYKPGAEEGEDRIFYETHDFSADGKTILFTSDVDTGAMGLSEIYTFDLESKELARLTNSWECHDEHANFSPNYEKIIWISTMQQQWALFKTDLLIMDSDGDNKKILVNSPSGIIADNDWSPDGTNIAFMNIDNNQDTNHDIYLVTLKGE